ncbi:MAG: response regulator [Nanoarchaeota archaeon]|nr:response regulator [Nanoarchaeota archaeon]
MAKKIMVVDDEPDTRALAKTVLEGEGYEVFTGSDGKDAIKKLAKECVDLILLDIMMPGMKPKEIIEEIEKLPTCRKTKISYFSVVEFSADQKKELFKSKKVVDYIQKPFTNDQLLAKVKKILK